jgi:hypothetical protein
MPADFDDIKKLANEDVKHLKKAEKSYGDSWMLRGGVGAFMMLCRKWDRIENQTKKENYDIFQTVKNDLSKTGILDDIRDLRRYLLLVESHTTKYYGEEWLEKEAKRYQEKNDGKI